MANLILIRAKFVCPVYRFPCWQHANAPAVGQRVLTQPATPLLAARHDCLRATIVSYCTTVATSRTGERARLAGVFETARAKIARNAILACDNKVACLPVYVYVGLNVSLYACSHNTSELREIFCTLSVVVARSSTDDTAMCCVLPVLWMTSCLPATGHGA